MCACVRVFLVIILVCGVMWARGCGWSSTQLPPRVVFKCAGVAGAWLRMAGDLPDTMVLPAPFVPVCSVFRACLVDTLYHHRASTDPVSIFYDPALSAFLELCRFRPAMRAFRRLFFAEYKARRARSRPETAKKLFRELSEQQLPLIVYCCTISGFDRDYVW